MLFLAQMRSKSTGLKFNLAFKFCTCTAAVHWNSDGTWRHMAKRRFMKSRQCKLRRPLSLSAHLPCSQRCLKAWPLDSTRFRKAYSERKHLQEMTLQPLRLYRPAFPCLNPPIPHVGGDFTKAARKHRGSERSAPFPPVEVVPGQRKPSL